MSIVLLGSTSGSVTLQEPAVAGTTVLDLPATSGNVVVDSATQTLTNKTIEGGTVISGTAVASTSGTSIDFTSIPSWVKRITVMFKNVSTNGTSYKQIQLGAGSVTTSGYQSSSSLIYGTNLCVVANETVGFFIRSDVAAEQLSGTYVFTSIGSNGWVGSSVMHHQGDRVWQGAGRIDLGGTLDRVRITTINGTDAFDVGTINILYE